MATESDSPTIVEINGLTRTFGSLRALDNISLNIHKGELFGLLGPNGAGKTTLISILSTILPVTSGTARVCGFRVSGEDDQVRRSIGIVFQDPSLDEELSGEENLDFHGRLYGMDSPTRIERVREVLDLVDLTDRRKDMVKTYSGGMRRRLEIARGLMHTPKVLYLDEPTLGLDPQTRRKIWDCIRTLKQRAGMTIILTTHYMDEADQLCSRIAIMDRGRIVALGSPEELKSGMGGDVLELDLSRSDERFLQKLRDSDDVTSVESREGRLGLTVANGAAFMPKAFEMAREFGLEISSVSMRSPNLEDVFIKLTGREIRDEPSIEVKERMRLYFTRKK